MTNTSRFKSNLTICTLITLSFLFRFVNATELAKARPELMTIDGHLIHVAFWGSTQSIDKPWVVLISGPIDSWHSDTAWFAALAPMLAKDFRVIAIDRAGLVSATKNAPIGYTHFATDMAQILKKFSIEGATLVAFATANLTAIHLLNDEQQHAVSNVVLIDPDVLTEFSIARYSADVDPFKQNLDAYLDYIKQGKYTARVEQKNQTDLDTLNALAAGLEVEWDYVLRLMKARLDVINQLNLFKEIAFYQDDLNAAAKLTWPQNIPTLIIDTQFEQAYIEQAEDPTKKQELITWQQDAKQYYQSLAALSSHNQYLELDSRAHLFQFEQPQRLMGLINTLRKKVD